MPTLKDALEEARSSKERGAIYRNLREQLRFAYLPRDSMPTPRVINCEGAPVRVETIHMVLEELEEAETDAYRAADAILAVKHGD